MFSQHTGADQDKRVESAPDLSKAELCAAYLLNMAPLTDPKLDKISQGQPGLWRAFFNRRNIAGVAGAVVFGPGLQLGKTGAVAGFLLVRWVYSKTEQFVPFTKRRHNVLLPSVAGKYGNVRSPAYCTCA